MGSRGFAPRPLALRDREGDPGHRTREQLNLYDQATPDPILSTEPPEFLSDDAKEEWRKLAPILFRNLLFTEIDENQFALFCSAWGDWVEIEKARRLHPQILVKNREGVPVPNPLIKASHRASELVYKYLKEFGMSPAARMRVTTAQKKDKKDRGDDAWARLAEQRKKINQQIKNNPLPDIEVNDDD